MTPKLISEAVKTLLQIAATDRASLSAGRGQFNALLSAAKLLYPERVDIHALDELSSMETTAWSLMDAIARLDAALSLRSTEGPTERLRLLSLPGGLPDAILADIAELRVATECGAHKSALLLAGLIAESLLLLGHPDTSDRGPGLSRLVKECRDSRRFGRDTLRHLDTLIDYRDLIHPRAALRNQIAPTTTRVDAAIIGLSLLCAELADEQRNP